MLQEDKKMGAIYSESIRYVMLRPDALMGILKYLEGTERLAVLEAITASFSNFGAKSVGRYVGMGNSETEGLLEKVVKKADSFGWGIWEFDLDAKRLVLNVRNSPFAEGYGKSEKAVCAPIKGMFSAISRQIFGNHVKVGEMECGAVTGYDYCKFVCIKD